MDAQWREMGFSKEFGGSVFKKRAPQGNLFAGLKFNEYVGVEVGYESTKKAKRNVKLVEGQSNVGGDILERNEFIKTSTTFKIHGPHINVIGFLPIAYENRLQLLGSIGVANLRLKASSSPTGSNVTPEYSPEDKARAKRTFNTSKLVARIGAGVQYSITDSISIRTTAHWENTYRFKKVISKEFGGRLKMKNSMIVSLGAFLTF